MLGSGANVSNLRFNESLVGGYSAAGVVAGVNQLGNIVDVEVNGTASALIGSGCIVGGNGGNITRCFADCLAGSFFGYSGGLVGYTYSDNSTITRSYAIGNVTSLGGIGGLVGYNLAGLIDDCYAKTNVYPILAGHINNATMGGLVGWNANISDTPGIVNNSYADSNVRVNDTLGGLVGLNDVNCIIQNSFSTSNVTGDTRVGGVAGKNYGDIVNTWWDKSGQRPDSMCGLGAGCDDLKAKEDLTYWLDPDNQPMDSWDFTDVWFSNEILLPYHLWDRARYDLGPTLSQAQIDKDLGDTSYLFNYTITYTDLDDDGPEYVKLLIDGVEKMMQSTSTSYSQGVIYYYNSSLSAGTHSYSFTASDGYQSTSYALTSGPRVFSDSPTCSGDDPQSGATWEITQFSQCDETAFIPTSTKTGMLSITSGNQLYLNGTYVYLNNSMASLSGSLILDASVFEFI